MPLAVAVPVLDSVRNGFSALLEDPTQFALLLTIDSKALEVLTAIPSSTNFDASLYALRPHLLPDRALFILIRRRSEPPLFTCVTYLPQKARKSAVTIAATQLELTGKLGSGYFADSMVVGETKELVSENFEDLESGNEKEAPLTEQERAMKKVTQDENTGRQGGSQRREQTGRDMKLAADAEVLEKLQELKRAGNNLVMLRIDTAAETIKLAGSTTTTLENLTNELSEIEPRYSIFRYSDDTEEGNPVPVVFIYTCPPPPEGANLWESGKQRMIYAKSKSSFIKVLEDELGLFIIKSLEKSNPSDITTDDIEDRLQQPKQEFKQELKPRFDRPKRPGRK